MYRRSASGERRERTTSAARWLELAKTHPLVHTFYAYGGEFGLSLSLAVSGKAFAMGMNTQQVDPSLVALWWCPLGTTGWSPQETEAARSVFLDLCEVEAGSLWPSESSDVQEEAEGAAAAGAASGAPEGREKKIVHPRSSSAVLHPVTYWRMVEAAEAQAKDETCGSADAEGEDSRGAASGASDLQEEGTQADEQARARDARRQVHFADAARPARESVELWSEKNAKNRRQRIVHLVEVLRRVGWPVPKSVAFKYGIPHLSQNVMFLGLLREKIEGEGFDRVRVCCEDGVPGPRVESVDLHHPIWQTLRGTWGVKALPEFLKHICNDEHDGEEVRLLRRTWAPLPRDVDPRHPAFWSLKFMREEESRRWLKDRGAAQRLTWADVTWLLMSQKYLNETLLICKYVAASGAHAFSIRAGTAATLAQMHHYGEELCTACDIHRLYMDAPILIRNKNTGEERHRRRQRRRVVEPSGSC